MREIPSTYDQSKESEIYKLWEESGFFNPDNFSGKAFTISMPPPNATALASCGQVLIVCPTSIADAFILVDIVSTPAIGKI